MPLKSSSIAPTTTAAFAPPTTLITDGAYVPDDAAITANFGTNLSRCVLLGNTNGSRERGAELMFWGVESADTDITLNLFLIERITQQIQDGAGADGYFVRAIGTVVATLGATAVAGIQISDDPARWADTLATLTLSTFGTLLLSTINDATPQLYSPASDGIASLHLPDLGGAFALGVVPDDSSSDAIGVVAKRLT